METKPLLYGLIGFFIGGFIVSVAATTFEKPVPAAQPNNSDMIALLRDKKGDDFDQMFISEMIVHHQGAVDMAKLSAQSAKHDEIKQLSTAIIAAQEKEISQLRQWQKEWGYPDIDRSTHPAH